MKKTTQNIPNIQLKQARELKGWSQEHVAQEIGTDAFTVSRWERGISAPGPHFRQKLSSLFDLTVTELGLIRKSQDEQLSPPADLRSQANLPIFDPTIPFLLTGEDDLVGREDLLHTLKQRLLATKHVGLSALNGLPGVGKTALAKVLACDIEIRSHFSDGVLWAGLGRNPDVLALLSHWGTLLGSEPTDRSQLAAWATTIRSAIGERRFLFVIDDVWDLAHALALQVGGPHCAYIITTRFPAIALHITSEGATVIRELPIADGRRLLQRLAPDVVQAEPEMAQALVATVGGLPLALTLLGNYLRAQSHSGQPRRLREALDRLRDANARLRLSEPQSLIEGHPSLPSGAPISLQAVISISDQQVSENARSALRALSLFPPKPNTFSESAARVVSGLPTETLDELADAGLLESSSAERYTLHQTIADYAYSQLIDTLPAERMVIYMVEYVEMQRSNPAMLDSESANILASFNISSERRMLSEFMRGVHAFAPFLIARGLYAVAETLLEHSLDAARSLENADNQAIAHLYLGEIAEQRANYMQAHEHWQRSLLLARESKRDGLLAEALLRLGMLARQQGQPEQAHQFLNDALSLCRKADNRRLLGVTLRNLGILLREQGQPEQARQLYEEALQASKLVDDQQEVARTLNNLGVLTRQQGQPERARQLYEEALTIFEQLGDRRGAATTLGNLSRIAEIQGQPERARQRYEEALATFRQLGDRRGTAQVLHNLGTILQAQGQLSQASQLLEEALIILRDVGDKRTATLTQGALAILAREQGDFVQAHDLLLDVLATFQQLGDRHETAMALRELGIVAREQGQFVKAHDLFSEAHFIFQQLEDHRERAFILRELGILNYMQTQEQEALLHLQEALTIFQHLGEHREEARTLKELGILAQQQEQLEYALQQFLKAGVGLTLVKAPDLLAVKERLGQLYTQLAKDIFVATANDIADFSPQALYNLTQTEWSQAVQRLVNPFLVEG